MNSFKNFQSKIGADVDGYFGEETFRLGKVFLMLTDIQAVHFFAQCAHESAMFRYFSENLNYSRTALLKIFRKYFNEENVDKYARDPELIANCVYSNRMGNGDELSGDGWKYRGRGAIQLTGKDNYTNFAKYMQDQSIVECPDIVETDYAFDSAIFFFKSNDLFDICVDTSTETVKKLTRRINGGYNGIYHRLALTKSYTKFIKS